MSSGQHAGSVSVERVDRPLLFGKTPLASVLLDGLVVQRFTVRAGSMRKAAVVRAEPRLLFAFVLQGVVDVRMTHEPMRHWASPAGRGFFLRSADDCLVAWDDGTDAILVSIREQIATGFGAAVADGALPQFAEASALVAPAVGFFRGVLGAAAAPGRVAAYALARLSEEMLGGLLLERSSIGAGAVRVQPSLYRRALAHMASRRSDARFTPAVLAADLAVSLRHLQRAFQQQGTSASVELRRLRIELAVQLLTEARYAVLAVSEIAAYAGFATVDDMRRAFRLERLPSPSRVRANAAGANAGMAARERS